MAKRQVIPEDGTRWIVCRDGVPNGWCMGLTREIAIMHWLRGTGQRIGSPDRLDDYWQHYEAEGYTVRRFRLAPVDGGEAPH